MRVMAGPDRARMYNAVNKALEGVAPPSLVLRHPDGYRNAEAAVAYEPGMTMKEYGAKLKEVLDFCVMQVRARPISPRRPASSASALAPRCEGLKNHYTLAAGPRCDAGGEGGVDVLSDSER